LLGSCFVVTGGPIIIRRIIIGVKIVEKSYRNIFLFPINCYKFTILKKEIMYTRFDRHANMTEDQRQLVLRVYYRKSWQREWLSYGMW
jgi:hypothetical protein